MPDVSNFNALADNTGVLKNEKVERKGMTRMATSLKIDTLAYTKRKMVAE